MRKSFLYVTLGFVAAAFATIYGCTKKVNGINNDQVIETPYGLFFSDTAGTLFVTNDGKQLKQYLSQMVSPAVLYALTMATYCGQKRIYTSAPTVKILTTHTTH